jgi:hypothetical protein
VSINRAVLVVADVLPAVVDVETGGIVEVVVAVFLTA